MNLEDSSSIVLSCLVMFLENPFLVSFKARPSDSWGFPL